MVRKWELESEIAQGRGTNKLAELISSDQAFPAHPHSAEDVPHVHPDQSVDVALERMGESGYNVLPVVSRANVRQLEGVVTLDDILEAYGVAKHGGSHDGHPENGH
jgi:CBS domain-containing protein